MNTLKLERHMDMEPEVKRRMEAIDLALVRAAVKQMDGRPRMSHVGVLDRASQQMTGTFRPGLATASDGGGDGNGDNDGDDDGDGGGDGGGDGDLVFFDAHMLFQPPVAFRPHRDVHDEYRGSDATRRMPFEARRANEPARPAGRTRAP